MVVRWLLRVGLGALVVVQLPGCAHFCNKPCAQPGPLISRLAPSGRVLVPGPVYAGQPLPQVNAPLGSPVPEGQVYPPQWRAVPDNRPPSDPLAPGIRTYPPEWRAIPESEPPLADPANPRAGARLREPRFDAAPEKPVERNTPTPSLPVGIPQFTQARERVASGLKPLLDGLDWLQANGYRTFLLLRSPGQDDTADRREVEKRGLKYLSIEIGPQTLSRTLVEEFNRTVTDGALQPLFVCDKDGRLAGGLWYLHFRTADKSTDEAARTRAARLGLREDGDGEQRLWWLAIQKLLSEWGN